ncbi:hypothetical protein LTR17_013958 [Elasticomyces elasticus]|nr:hypothetical protein LTR17_013958 [Elasticomyces elasticus]
MAGPWFTLPKLFKANKNDEYEIIKNEPGLIQFKSEQNSTFKIVPKTATINANKWQVDNVMKHMGSKKVG